MVADEDEWVLLRRKRNLEESLRNCGAELGVGGRAVARLEGSEFPIDNRLRVAFTPVILAAVLEANTEAGWLQKREWDLVKEVTLTPVALESAQLLTRPAGWGSKTSRSGRAGRTAASEVALRSSLTASRRLHMVGVWRRSIQDDRCAQVFRVPLITMLSAVIFRLSGRLSAPASRVTTSMSWYL